MPRVHKVENARKPDKEQGIKKGDTYYWWKFRYGGKLKSKTYPRPQQLTRSGYKIAMYDIDDMKQALYASEGASALQEALDSIKESIEELKGECEESLENIPEQLQETCGAGVLLTERIEELESYHSDLEAIDIDDETDIEGDKEEYLQEKIEEIQGCDV
jgi:hypothetical protein